MFLIKNVITLKYLRIQRILKQKEITVSWGLIGNIVFPLNSLSVQHSRQFLLVVQVIYGLLGPSGQILDVIQRSRDMVKLKSIKKMGLHWSLPSLLYCLAPSFQYQLSPVCQYWSQNRQAMKIYRKTFIASSLQVITVYIVCSKIPVL